MFETYISRQLDLVQNATMSGEVTYDHDNKKSCDLFIVTPEIVVLVEVKAARPTIDVRNGSTGGRADIERKVGRAATN